MNLKSSPNQSFDSATTSSTPAAGAGPDGQARPTLAELKRFLDRLLSSSDGAEPPTRLQQEYHDSAVAMGVVSGDAAATSGQLLPIAELIERTRDCIRLNERERPADQALETMSAPPAMPEATP